MSLIGGEVEPNATEEGCQFIPGCYEGEGGAGKVAEASPNYTLEESTLPDPAPGAEGIWLGFRSTDCYEPYSSNWSHHPDLDNDGLDDTCEHVLAKAFRPMLSVSASEPCLGGEPYWVAKYINNSPFGTGDMVKLGYMPAYYEDCGPSDAHDGDSEFIQLTVVNNTITGHWILVNSWLSAHT